MAKMSLLKNRNVRVINPYWGWNFAWERRLHPICAMCCPCGGEKPQNRRPE